MEGPAAAGGHLSVWMPLGASGGPVTARGGRRTTFHAEEGPEWREGDFESFADFAFFSAPGKPSLVLRTGQPKGRPARLVLFWTLFGPRGRPMDLRELDRAKEMVLTVGRAAAEQYAERLGLPRFRLEVAMMPKWMIERIPNARVVQPEEREVG